MSDESGTRDVDLPFDPNRLEAGMSVLVAGPALTRKRQLLFRLVGGSPDRSAILVTSKQGADSFRDSFLATQSEPDQWDIRLVDCVSKGYSSGRLRDSEHRKNITSPGDLTGIGIGVSGFLREFHHDDRSPRVGLHTLSTLLMYADLKRVFQFTHLLTGRISSTGFSGVFTLDTTRRNTEAFDVLSGLFDAVVEVRDEGEEPELRVRGADLGSRRWNTF